MRTLTTVFIFFAVIILGISGCGNDSEKKEASTATSSGLHDRSEPYAPPQEYTPTELQTPPEPYAPPEAYTPTEDYTPPEPQIPPKPHT